MSRFFFSRRRAIVDGISLAAALPAGVSVSMAQPARDVAATVNAARMSEPITRYMFGGFLEHLGNLINYGLWSEVLDDRKFYYPVNSQPPVQGERSATRKWTPVGPNSSVTMDTAMAYVGDHSPVVALTAGEPRGIRQTGLSLAAGKDYVGRVVAAGDGASRITVTLIWGEGATDRQSVTLAVGKGWATHPLKFRSTGATTQGRIEITATGTGSFRVGAVSLMPADNLHGFRADTIALMKQMNCGFLRLPGGNWISDHDWQDAIGDPDKRPPVYDDCWAALQPNDVGMDELMTLCRLVGAEPYVTVNGGFGEARSAGYAVEYCNGAVTTPMGGLRAANGHSEPYGVKYWNIGNEPYGFWQWGHMVVTQYSYKHNRFAKAMRKADPSIVLIASGAMPDEMTCTSNARRETGKVIADPGSVGDWTGMLLARCWGNFDMLSEHYYGRSGQRFDLAKGQTETLQPQNLPVFRGGGGVTGFVPAPADEPLTDWARRPANRVRCKAEAWEDYKKRFAMLRDGRIKVAMDEWAYNGSRPGMRQNLAIATALHEKFRHTDFMTMSAYTMATAWLDYSRTDAAFSACGLLFRMYNEHFGRIPVEVTGNSPQPAPAFPVGGDQPRINAGSPTFPLDISAALTEDRKTLTIAAINATEAVQSLRLDLVGFRTSPQGRAWKMTGTSLDGANHVGMPAQVSVHETTFDAAASRLSAAPHSIEIYAFAVG
ncbi:MAG TPA: hypothetical protein VGM26_13650 [Rhizomicrobium sp.]|jgi:alpha-N-arabinofuranosidase